MVNWCLIIVYSHRCIIMYIATRIIECRSNDIVVLSPKGHCDNNDHSNHNCRNNNHNAGHRKNNNSRTTGSNDSNNAGLCVFITAITTGTTTTPTATTATITTATNTATNTTTTRTTTTTGRWRRQRQRQRQQWLCCSNASSFIDGTGYLLRLCLDTHIYFLLPKEIIPSWHLNTSDVRVIGIAYAM